MNIRFIVVIFLLLSLSSNASFAQSFGKVFSTPQERQFLDREREKALAELTEQERIALLDAPPVSAGITAIEPTLIHMGGSVRRADGNHTIWLNGVAVSQSELPSNAHLEFVRGLGILRVQGVDQEYIVKPGQTLNADTGAIREDYELTEDELKEVNAAVTARDAAARPAIGTSSTTESPVGDSSNGDDSDEQQAMIQSIVDGLRLLQQARDFQDSVQ